MKFSRLETFSKRVLRLRSAPSGHYIAIQKKLIKKKQRMVLRYTRNDRFSEADEKRKNFPLKKRSRLSGTGHEIGGEGLNLFSRGDKIFFN